MWPQQQQYGNYYINNNNNNNNGYYAGNNGINNNPQFYQFQQVETTTPTINPNGSIDFVVSQIEHLANGIHSLTVDGEAAGLTIADRGVQTFEKMKEEFSNSTIQNVDRLVEIVNERFSSWPVTELVVMIIIGVVLVIITLIFLFMLFGERVTAYRYRKKLSVESDIENI